MAKAPVIVKGILRSRLDHQVILSYADDTIALAPRATSGLVEKEKLGALPSGVLFIQK